MFSNYFKIALRNLAKYKVYSLINVLGLAIGLAASLLLTVYIVDEITFDQFHEKSDRIYRLIPRIEVPGQAVRRVDESPGALSFAVSQNFPEIEAMARITPLGRADITYENNAYYEAFLTADASLFDVFDFPFIQGDSESALSRPSSVIVTEETARKYFGDENPIGKTLTSVRGDYRVTGVLKDIPSNSHLQFGMLFSTPTELRDLQNSWDELFSFAYFLLTEDASAVDLESKIANYTAEGTPDQIRQVLTPELQALEDIHFGSGDIENSLSLNPGSFDTILVLTGIVFFILFIACINYVNLATARSVSRAKEIGLRKVVGAGRRQLIIQFLAESILLTCLAFLIALVFAQLLLPFFSEFTGKVLELNTVLNLSQGYLIFIAIILIGIGAGTYPAFYLANIGLTGSLKGKNAANSSSLSLRKGLVVIQFCLSIILLIATLVSRQQIDYISSKTLGFDSESLIVVDINSGSSRENYAVIKNLFLNNPNVSSVSVSSRVPGEWKNLQQVDTRRPSEDDTSNQRVTFIGGDSDFLETFAIELLAGRNMLPTESTTSNLIVNEALATSFGWGQQEAIGQQIVLSDGQETIATVVGVVSDFHFRSLHEEIGPLIIANSHTAVQSIDYFTAKINSVDIAGTIQHLRQAQAQFDPETPFEYHFLDEQIASFYESDRLTASLFQIAAILAVFIACLGLYGLSAIATEQRTKEIGIRKVLGASVTQLVTLLTFDFVKLVVLANLIAWPVVYYLMNIWLRTFAYHSDIDLVSFILAGLYLIIAALITVGGYTMQVAKQNPAKSIRYE